MISLLILMNLDRNVGTINKFHFVYSTNHMNNFTSW